MTQVTKHFTRAELACKHCGKLFLTPAFLERLERIREKMAMPLVISSACRCPDYNEKVSSTGRAGPHTKGAVDVAIRGSAALRLVELAIAEGMTGIGVNQKGDARFIHLDDLPDEPDQPRPTIWSY